MQYFPCDLVVLSTLERIISLFDKDEDKTSGKICKTG